MSIAALLVLASTALADSGQAVLERPTQDARQIAELQFDEDSPRLEEESWIISGALSSKFGSLLVGEEPVELEAAREESLPTDPRRFEVRRKLDAPETLLRWTYVDPSGKSRREKTILKIDDLPGYLERLKAPEPSGWTPSVGLGVTQIAYAQTGLQDFSETAMTFKGGISHRWGQASKLQRWEAGLSGFINLFPLVTPDVPWARFLGVNLRAGYPVWGAGKPTRFKVSGGWYYTTTFVSGGLYGFAHLMGPQLYPSVEHDLSRGRGMIGGYLKYSPVRGSGFSFLPLSNREIAVGARWSRAPDSRGRIWSVELDVSSIAGHAQDLQVRAATASLSGSLAF
jgi:hypothetical protein